MEVDSPEPQQRVDASTAELRVLAETDKQVAQLLSIAGEALAGLHPQTEDGHGEWEATSADQAGDTHAKTDEFYKLLNDVSVSLRASARRLRLNKASPLPLLFQAPSHSAVAPGSIASDPQGKSGLALGLNAQRIEAATWRDLKQGLAELQSQNLAEPLQDAQDSKDAQTTS